MEALRQAFRPEFINRIDDIVLFNPLAKDQLNKIIDLELAKVMKLLAEPRLLKKSAMFILCKRT